MNTQSFGFSFPAQNIANIDAVTLQNLIAIQATAIVVAQQIEKTTPMSQQVLVDLITAVKAALK